MSEIELFFIFTTNKGSSECMEGMLLKVKYIFQWLILS